MSALTQDGRDRVVSKLAQAVEAGHSICFNTGPEGKQPIDAFWHIGRDDLDVIDRRRTDQRLTGGGIVGGVGRLPPFYMDFDAPPDEQPEPFARLWSRAVEQATAVNVTRRDGERVLRGHLGFAQPTDREPVGCSDSALRQMGFIGEVKGLGGQVRIVGQNLDGSEVSANIAPLAEAPQWLLDALAPSPRLKGWSGAATTRALAHLHDRSSDGVTRDELARWFKECAWRGGGLLGDAGIEQLVRHYDNRTGHRHDALWLVVRQAVIEGAAGGYKPKRAHRWLYWHHRDEASAAGRWFPSRERDYERAWRRNVEALDPSHPYSIAHAVVECETRWGLR